MAYILEEVQSPMESQLKRAKKINIEADDVSVDIEGIKKE